MGRHAKPQASRAATRGRHRKPAETLGSYERPVYKARRRIGAAVLAAAVGWSVGGALSSEQNTDIIASPHVAESLADTKTTDKIKKLGGLASWNHRSHNADRALATSPTPTPKADTLELQSIEVTTESRPERDYDPVYHRGKLFDKYTVELLKRFEKGLEEAGVPFTYYTQGSYSTSNPSSGSTHAGGGAVDYSINAYGGPYSKNALIALREQREAGLAAHIRLAGEAGSAAHIHAIAIGNESASEAAKEQVKDYLNGRNGLVNNAPDRYAESVGLPNPEWVEELKPELL